MKERKKEAKKLTKTERQTLSKAAKMSFFLGGGEQPFSLYLSYTSKQTQTKKTGPSGHLTLLLNPPN